MSECRDEGVCGQLEVVMTSRVDVGLAAPGRNLLFFGGFQWCPESLFEVVEGKFGRNGVDLHLLGKSGRD